MQTYTQGDLQIRSAIPVTDINQFYMKVDRNDHAVCRIEGTVPENCAEDAVLQPLSGTLMMAGAGSRMLFAGRIREVQMTHEGTSYHVTVTGVSMTEQLDLIKRDRSFQDVSMTYRGSDGTGGCRHAGDKIMVPRGGPGDSEPAVSDRGDRLGIFKKACRQAAHRSCSV